MALTKYVLIALILVNLLNYLTALPAVDDPIVTLSHGGKVRGSITFSNYTRKEYLSFKGIPYAEPPTGKLRFKATVPHNGWDGIRDATQHGAICLQPGDEKDEIVGSEDCLFLNVFVPNNKFNDEKLPVMIYIHGGAFHGGSGNEDKQNPEFLLGEDVIVVQINYRLSFLGFFSTADRNAPGNYGLKDSLEALRWVQSNIEAFGGDKDKVTVFGESAGGMIINYLKLSPLSKGLFHRAITESGSIMGSALSFQSYPRTYAFQIAKEMNITFENSEDLVRQLMEIEDARIFVKYSPEWIRDFQIPMGKTGLVFAPSVEPEDSDEPRVLPDTPLNLYLKGDFLDIPHIIMLMSEEHLMSARQLEEFPELFDHIEQNQEVLLPLTWNIRPNTLEADEYLRTINALYFNNEPIKNIYDYLHFASDSLWNFGSYKAARLQVTRQKSPVYFAVFSFSGDLSYFKISGGLKDFIGAGHADDLPYIFTTEYFPTVTEDNPSYKVRARTVKIWTNFAKYGDPTPVLDELVNVKWEPMRDGFFSFMNMSTEMHLERDPFGDRMKVWYEMDRRFN